MSWKNKLIKLIVGKNAPALARSLMTLVGSALLASVLFKGTGELSPEALEAAKDLGIPTTEEVKDGLTFGELAASLGGMVLIFGSRVQSFLRAKNLPKSAQMVGSIIGRSIPSLIRAMLTAAAGGVAWLTGNPAMAPDVIADHQVASGLVAVIVFMLTRWSSATEDEKLNPAEPLPSILSREPHSPTLPPADE